MFAVPSGVEVPSQPTARASARGAPLATTGRSTGAQLWAARALARGRGVGTRKAGSTGAGRPSARELVERRGDGVPFAVVRWSAAAAHAASAATPIAPFPRPRAVSRLIWGSARCACAAGMR